MGRRLRGRVEAEAAVHTDPRTACFYARRALELAVSWAFKHDPGLITPGNRAMHNHRLCDGADEPVTMT